MYSGIIGRSWVAYEVPAAVNAEVELISLMPMCLIWPCTDSL